MEKKTERGVTEREPKGNAREHNVVKVSQPCTTLCDPMGYTVHGILQARIPKWVAFPFFRGSSQPRERIQVSHIVGDSSRTEPLGKVYKKACECFNISFMLLNSLNHGGIICFLKNH